MNNNAAIKWSSQQVAIFEWFKNGRGNLVVRARAGTGKTTTIMESVRYAKERRVLLCAFNKVIAEELTNRLKKNGATNVIAKTLHAYGFTVILKSEWNQGGNKITLSQDRGREIAKVLCGANNNPNNRIAATLVYKIASLAKGAAPHATEAQLADIACEFGFTPDESQEAAGWTLDRISHVARKAMDRAQQFDGTIDFDDMVYLPVVKGWVRPEFGLVVVDEAQDMNYSQLLLAQQACAKGGRIVVVGDDRQAIYGFRGADSNSIDRLKKELNAQEMGLTITRRCPKNVVAIAQGLVPDFEAAEDAPDGEAIQLPSHKLIDAATPGSFILSRTNAPLVSICFGLIRARKRAIIRGRDIGQGLVSIVKKLNAKSIEDFRNKLHSWSVKEISKAKDQKEHVAQAILSRVEDQYQVLSVFASEVNSVDGIITCIEQMFADDTGPAFVVCSSVHKAKGLESDDVFVINDTFYKGQNHYEEQNIEYVAVTRAKKRLFVVPNAPNAN